MRQRQSSNAATRYSILVLLYVAIVVAHLLAFRDSYEYPQYVTDAVQYVTTAQNIAAGNGYTIRGQFNTTNPPLYPAFLALTISQKNDPMWPAFVWQTILMGLIVFPAFSLARQTGLSFSVSAILSAAAGMLPHTFFCAIYMQEVLQYPLWMWACALAYGWLHRPCLKGGVWLGISLSLLMLNKVNSSVLFVPLMVACGVKLMGEVRSGALSRWSAAKLALAPAAVVFISLGAWLLFKFVHGANSLGLYGIAARSAMQKDVSLPLMLAYASDFFLASGLLCVVPLCYFLSRRWRTDRPAALFFGLLFGMQILWVGFFDGGDSGMVRERLMSFSFPVVAILAARGFVELRENRPARWRYWFVVLPVVLVAGLRAGNPGAPSGFETPWTFAFGGGFLDSPPRDARAIFPIAAICAIILVSAVLLKTRERRATWLFAACILLCNAFAFTSTASAIVQGAKGALSSEDRLIGWMSSNGAGYGARVLVVSLPAVWEMRSFADPAEGLFRGCTTAGLADPVILARYETILRWDVRTVCTAKEVARAGRPGDLILAGEDLGPLLGVRHVAGPVGPGLRLFQIPVPAPNQPPE
jgi:Dolichyl-phosphate-mannose-protein mannosyltransferase